MKRTSLLLFTVLCAAPLFADAGEHLVPAGSLIGCTISEPKISSRTTAVGDPVLCQVSRSERYGRSTLPYNSYLVGRFEDYKDPGHFVGKGWMELRFDRMVIQPDTVIPIDARVVDAPGYRVDNKGRILGKGHAVRDTVLWTIPILWPIDLAMLPMRGPRPTLKEESRLTLKIMDDLPIPAMQQQMPQQDPYGLMHRSPNSYNDPPQMQDQPAPQQYADAAPQQEMQPGPQQPMDAAPQQQYADAAPPADYSQPDPGYAPDPNAYAPPPPAYGYAPAVIAPPPMVYGQIYIGPRYPVGMAYGPRYGYAGPRVYGYGGPRMAPRGYGYGGVRQAPRAYGYGGGQRQASQSYGRGGGYMTARAGGGMGARGGMGGGGFRGSYRGR